MIEIKIKKVTLMNSRIVTIKDIKKYYEYFSSTEAKEFMDSLLSGDCTISFDEYDLRKLNKIFGEVEYDRITTLSEDEKRDIEYWDKIEKETIKAQAWYETLGDVEKAHVDVLSRHIAPTG